MKQVLLLISDDTKDNSGLVYRVMKGGNNDMESLV